jgi:hypothetical protein
MREDNLIRIDTRIQMDELVIPTNEEEFNNNFNNYLEEELRPKSKINSFKIINNSAITCHKFNEQNDFSLQNHLTENQKLSFFEGKDPAIKLNRLKMVFLIQFLLIIDTLIEGNDKFPSLFGIRKCTPLFWTVFFSFGLFCLWYTYNCYKIVREEDNLINRNSISSETSEFRICSKKAESKMYKIMIFCFIAGLMSGMLGVGGGIVMAPLMLELGLHPKTTASTSNFLLIMTSSFGTVMFILSQQLIFTFAIFIAVPCTLASYVGSGYILDYITKTNKNSFLVYCLLYVMIFSLIILPINGISRAMYDMASGENIFGFNTYC